MDYNTIPNDAALAETVQNMQGRAFDVSVVDTREQALDAIIKMIPQGATVMNGSSTTLQEIGFVDYLQKNEHDWQNMHTSLLAEKDPAKQRDLRRASEFHLALHPQRPSRLVDLHLRHIEGIGLVQMLGIGPSEDIVDA